MLNPHRVLDPRRFGAAAVRSRVVLLGGLIAFHGCASTGCRFDGLGQSEDANEAAATAAAADDGQSFAFEIDVRRPDAESPRAAAPTAAGCSRFVDVATEHGLSHVYHNGEAGRSLMVEAIGGGAGWLDYDRDERWDLYLVQGGDPATADRQGQPADRLFRNDGQAFRDSTDAARLAERGYGQGVAIGDYDEDGFDDIYVTNVGRNALYHNLGDGTFLDVTAEAGVGDSRWSSSAAWADLDGDGDLDLYVCNYLNYDPLEPLDCRNAAGEPRICHPRDIDAVADECFLNQGDGTFHASAVALGLHGPGNKALGVAVADFTGDGLPDIYVANDTEPNFLFRRRGDGTYDEVALALGCAVDRDGNAQASMGVAAGDYDADGVLDLYVTHFHDDSNTLYRGLGQAGFEDVTGLGGLHGPTLDRLGFGAVMADFDADSRAELLVANGHIENYPGNPLLAMRPQLFEWQSGRWFECSDAAGPFFARKQVGRGVALADYDADGDLDAVVVHQNTPTALLENRSARGRYLACEFIGVASNRRGIGCRVTVRCGDVALVQQLCGGTSYASSHQPRLFFGLGDCDGPCTVDVMWPSGVRQSLDRVAVDQVLTLREPEAGVSADR